ncbi:MAG: hypothetical protein ACM31N_02950 [Deltaproteobacteria bacterium]
MKSPRRIAIWILFALICCLVTADEGDIGIFRAGIAHAQEDWRKEFDDVCSRTQDAMVISSGELKNLVDRCDKLKPRIEKLDESQRKVYLKRLHMCRDLYFFVLESREKKQ